MGTVILSPSCSLEVRHHLAEILESPAFRASQRSQQFLQYVVEESLNGRGDLLKERVIGEHVFGRQADYDTGQDSIVRVKANEVRRRLAQFYEQHPNSSIRIEMVSGSYGVRIRMPEKPASSELTIPMAAPVPVQSRRNWAWAVGILLMAFAAAGMASFRASRPGPTRFDQFWQPFLHATKPLLICMPAPEAFRIYGRDKDLLLRAYESRAPGAAPPAMPALKDVRIVPEPGLLVGLGDARALALIQAFAAVQGVRVNTRASAVTTYADLSSGPSVVIGGETNHWSAELAQGHRFYLKKTEGGRSAIWDKEANHPACVKPHSWEQPSTQDCGIITRIPKVKGGGSLLLVAGLDHYGTLAVGELVINASQLEPVIATAREGWESRNLQIYFTVDRVRDGVGEPQVKAVHTW